MTCHDLGEVSFNAVAAGLSRASSSPVLAGSLMKRMPIFFAASRASGVIRFPAMTNWILPVSTSLALRSSFKKPICERLSNRTTRFSSTTYILLSSSMTRSNRMGYLSPRALSCLIDALPLNPSSVRSSSISSESMEVMEFMVNISIY